MCLTAWNYKFYLLLHQSRFLTLPARCIQFWFNFSPFLSNFFRDFEIVLASRSSFSYFRLILWDKNHKHLRKTIIEKTNIKNLFIKNPKHTEDRCTPSDSNPLLNHDILLSIILIIIVNNHEFLSSLLITFFFRRCH